MDGSVKRLDLPVLLNLGRKFPHLGKQGSAISFGVLLRISSKLLDSALLDGSERLLAGHLRGNRTLVLNVSREHRAQKRRILDQPEVRRDVSC